MKNSGDTMRDVLFELEKMQMGLLETAYEQARLNKDKALFALDTAHYSLVSECADKPKHVAESRAVLQTMELREAWATARDHFEMCRTELRDFRAHCNASRFNQTWIDSIKAAAQRDKAERPSTVEPKGETE